MDKLYTLVGGPLDGLKYDCLYYCNQLINYYDKETDSYKSATYIREAICYETSKNKLEQDYKYYEYYRYEHCTIEYCLQSLVDNYGGNNAKS